MPKAGKRTSLICRFEFFPFDCHILQFVDLFDLEKSLESANTSTGPLSNLYDLGDALNSLILSKCRTVKYRAGSKKSKKQLQMESCCISGCGDLAVNHPWFHLPTSCAQKLEAWLMQQCLPEDQAAEYVSQVVNLVVEDLGKVFVGHLLVAQLVLRQRPSALAQCSPVFEQLLRENRDRAYLSALLFWFLRQATHFCFPTACRVFMDVLLPALDWDLLVDRVVQFAEDLAQVRGSAVEDAACHPVGFSYRDFVLLFDMLHPQSESNESRPLVKDVLPRLQALYLRLFRPFGLQNQSPDNLRLLYPALLIRLARYSTSSVAFNHLLSCLSYCLVHSPGTMSDWPQYVTESDVLLRSTSLLLRHIQVKSNELLLKMRIPSLRDALHRMDSILATNTSLQSCAEEGLRKDIQVLLESCTQHETVHEVFSRRKRFPHTHILLPTVLLLLCGLLVDWCHHTHLNSMTNNTAHNLSLTNQTQPWFTLDHLQGVISTYQDAVESWPHLLETVFFAVADVGLRCLAICSANVNFIIDHFLFAIAFLHGLYCTCLQ